MERFDVVIVGGGHNGLVAAAYLARAGRSVLVLERSLSVGGAAVSEELFDGVRARLSRYAYLVSLFPRRIAEELGLPLQLVRRRVACHPPIDHDEGARRLGARMASVAERVFPTLTEPLRSRDEFRGVVGDEEAWELLFEQPIGLGLRRLIADDEVRGIVSTDALIGTFTDTSDPSLLANRCLLYHVIGNGTGRWDVPVGGMGAVTSALAQCATDAGAQLRTNAQVVALEPGADKVSVFAAMQTFEASHVLVNAAPYVLDELLVRPPREKPEGAQLKVNMLVDRLPALRDGALPEDAFAGTFHVNEAASQLQAAFEQARAGQVPDVPPCEIYCHSLSDPTILSPELRAAGAHTLTLFALHMPARLFAQDRARELALARTLASLNTVLAEPIEDRLWRDAAGKPCIEVMTPLDVERNLAMPGGHIFHGDLQWPFAEDETDVGRWGVETDHPRVLLCGAGARRGGGVSGIPGYNAAMAVLEGSRR